MQIFKNRSNLLIVLQCGQLLYGVLVSPHIQCFQISCERWQILFFRRILDKKICQSFKTNCTLPIEVAGQGFFQRRQSIYISCEVRRRQSVIHILYTVHTLLQKQTHVTLSNLSLSKATSKWPLGPDFQKNSVRSQREQAWKLIIFSSNSMFEVSLSQKELDNSES